MPFHLSRTWNKCQKFKFPRCAQLDLYIILFLHPIQGNRGGREPPLLANSAKRLQENSASTKLNIFCTKSLNNKKSANRQQRQLENSFIAKSMKMVQESQIPLLRTLNWGLHLQFPWKMANLSPYSCCFQPPQMQTFDTSSPLHCAPASYQMPQHIELFQSSLKGP